MFIFTCPVSVHPCFGSRTLLGFFQVTSTLLSYSRSSPKSGFSTWLRAANQNIVFLWSPGPVLRWACDSIWSNESECQNFCQNRWETESVFVLKLLRQNSLSPGAAGSHFSKKREILLENIVITRIQKNPPKTKTELNYGKSKPESLMPRLSLCSQRAQCLLHSWTFNLCW